MLLNLTEKHKCASELYTLIYLIYTCTGVYFPLNSRSHFADMSKRTESPKIGTLGSIDEELQALADHISGYRRTLNSEGVWLFLATLGCWSVTLPPAQLVAYVIAVLTFGRRIDQRNVETRSFSTLIGELKNRIAELASSESEKKAGLYDLLAIRERELSMFTPFMQVKQFLLCWAFWGFSFVYSLHGLQNYLKDFKNAV